jgi:DNA-binding response OmpR family regulator
MCVDDDRKCLECRSVPLRAAGNEMLLAGGGQEARVIFATHHIFDLAILDYATPDFDRSHSASRLKDLARDDIFTISGETKFRLTRFAP